MDLVDLADLADHIRLITLNNTDPDGPLSVINVSKQSNTALHIACQYDDFDLIKYKDRYKADVNVKNEFDIYSFLNFMS
jgi:hypothetical protein